MIKIYTRLLHLYFIPFNQIFDDKNKNSGVKDSL